MSEKVLVMFSGGLDSLLTTCRIIEDGYKAILVHYDNGCMSGASKVCKIASKIIERYGQDKVEFWGIGQMAGYFYVLKNFCYTKYPTLSTLSSHYPFLIPQQVNCLTCRTAMYIFSILLCKQLGITKIAEGARKSQMFAIEQEEMLEEYKKLLANFAIELLLPVLDLESDCEREELLLIRQVRPREAKAQCWLGSPMHKPLSAEELADVVKYFQEELLESTLKLIKESEKIPLDNRGKVF